MKGFLAEFERIATANAADLERLIARGVDLVCVEPAIALLFRQEYAALGVAPLRVELPQEWLVRSGTDVHAAPAGDSPYVLLSHCTEATTAAAANALWRDAFAAVGLQLEIPSVGCCGMAGSWGLERRHRDESVSIFEQSWARRIAEHGTDRILAAGYSCRSQVARRAGFTPRHPLLVLREAIGAIGER